MKALAPAAMAAIIAGEAIVTGAADITPRAAGGSSGGVFDGGIFDSGIFNAAGAGAPVIRVWGGYGVFSFGGNQYLPLGDRAFAQQTSGAIGGVAQGITITLSGVEPAALALLDAGEIKGASIVVYRLIFASDGKTLLDAPIFNRYRGDALTSVEKVGGPAAIQLAAESTARGLGRKGARMRADYDQRLIDPADGYFKSAAYAGQKEAFWGGRKPANVGSSISPPNGNFGG